MQRVLVTGGAGFIGSHLVEGLVRSGWDATVIDDLSSGSLDNLEAVLGQIRFVHGSILDELLLNRAIEQADAVVHLAATVSVPGSVEDPVSCANLNVTGTVKVLAACRSLGVQKFVQASTSAVYGREPTLPKTESSPLAPVTPYAASKAAAEQFAAVFSAEGGMAASSLRFFNVYGPRQSMTSAYTGVIAIIMERLAKGEPMTIYGDGLQTRDFIFVEDVVEAVRLCLKSPHRGHKVLNVATGQSVTLLDVVAMLEKTAGRPLAASHGEERVGDIKHSSASIGEIAGLLGFAPKTALADGLAATYEWLKSGIASSI